MKKITIPVLAILIFSSLNIFAQENNLSKAELTGNLSYDSKLIFENYNSLEPLIQLPDESNKKSPVLAGLMSAVVPGAGEFYVGSYLKAAIFFAVDAALISAAIVYNNQGNDKEAAFQDFADAHWSVVKYADYLMQHKTELGLPDDVNILINRDNNLPPWEQIESWAALNYAETPFSHHLPVHGDQQYYEEIGKYNQYSSGWDEFNPATDGFRDVPQIMKQYAGMRGDANSAYNTATKFVLVVYLNHLLSAVDAVLSANSYNKELAVNVRMKNIQMADKIEMIPTVNFKLSF